MRCGIYAGAFFVGARTNDTKPTRKITCCKNELAEPWWEAESVLRSLFCAPDYKALVRFGMSVHCLFKVLVWLFCEVFHNTSANGIFGEYAHMPHLPRVSNETTMSQGGKAQLRPRIMHGMPMATNKQTYKHKNIHTQTHTYAHTHTLVRPTTRRGGERRAKPLLL